MTSKKTNQYQRYTEIVGYRSSWVSNFNHHKMVWGVRTSECETQDPNLDPRVDLHI